MMPINSHSMYNTHSSTNLNAETSAPVEVVKPEALLNRTFTLTKVNGAVPDAILGNSAYVKFDENFKFRAKIDNMMSGLVTYDNGILKSDGPIISTMMMGSDTENIFSNVLKEGAQVSMDGSKLVLQSNGNELIFE